MDSLKDGGDNRTALRAWTLLHRIPCRVGGGQELQFAQAPTGGTRNARTGDPTADDRTGLATVTAVPEPVTEGQRSDDDFGCTRPVQRADHPRSGRFGRVGHGGGDEGGRQGRRQGPQSGKVRGGTDLARDKKNEQWPMLTCPA